MLQFRDLRMGTWVRVGVAPGVIKGNAAFIHGAGVDIPRKDAILPEHQLKDVSDWLGTVPGKILNPAACLVPAAQYQRCGIGEVVVVEVRQEKLRHVSERDTGLKHLSVGARAVIEDERFVCDLHDVARSGSVRGGGWGIGTKQGELHVIPFSRCAIPFVFSRFRLQATARYSASPQVI